MKIISNDKFLYYEMRDRKLSEFESAYKSLVEDFEKLAREYYIKNGIQSVYRNKNGYLVVIPSLSEQKLIDYSKVYEEKRIKELLKKQEEIELFKETIELLNKRLKEENNG